MSPTRLNRLKHFALKVWRQMDENIFSLLSIVGFTLLILLAIFSQFLIPSADLYAGQPMMPPAWNKYGEITYILGTDHLGRDIFSRLLLGGSASVGIALLISLGIIVISSLLCLCNLFFRSAFVIIKVILNVLFVVPTLLMALIIVLVFGNSPYHIIIAVTLSLIPHFYNSLNHAIQTEANNEYVIAAHLDGASKWNIFIHSILPNIMTQCISYISTLFTFALLMLSTLNFLELGTSLQSNDWGSLMREYILIIDSNPTAFILPGLCLLSSVLLVHFFGVTLCRVLRNETC